MKRLMIGCKRIKGVLICYQDCIGASQLKYGASSYVIHTSTRKTSFFPAVRSGLMGVSSSRAASLPASLASTSCNTGNSKRYGINTGNALESGWSLEVDFTTGYRSLYMHATALVL